MARTIRDTLLSVRDLAVTAGPFVVLALVLLAGAFYLLKPAPPKRVALATGPEQGAYAEFGKRYAEELKLFGIEVVLRPTAGSRENLRLLRDPRQDVQIAFVQGGSSERLRDDGKEEKLPLISLGSMFYEPVWIFYRVDTAKKISKDGVLADFAQLRGLRVNVGARGSGIPGVMSRLLRANLMERDDIRRSNHDLTPGVVALLGGNLDAMALVSAPESPLIQMLLQTPGIRLFEFTQAEAYARRYNFLNQVTLPSGVVDLSRKVPPHDVNLVAATSSLVAREDIHPALIQLFVQAAGRIHGGSGWISRSGQFPSPLNSEFPLARDAERYYRNGPPMLQRYLPFWLANLVDRMWVALISIVAVLIPLSRILPPLYQFRIRRRIFRWYRNLRRIEDDLAREAAPRRELLAELDKLDAKAEHVVVPLAYTDQLYTLRIHIALVRERLRALRSE
ncbi:MAG: C4-dicarboxylate ABC transporter substrate-binding protein [Betaproteobacteria bacterium]|nr:C4-dicarboxylate ABC transporter substrate-binding protein [Betaproteobacteria bacterium]